MSQTGLCPKTRRIFPWGLCYCTENERTPLEAIRGERSVAEIAAHREVHANQVTMWKAQALKNLVGISGGRRRRARDHGDRSDPISGLAGVNGLQTRSLR